ncbi:hypothetical protein Barb4_02058 [Bacteroidales bacterium Barb4]|nr:hypothetical protein Barb4_02058 [Bacteroidales bacterium Barb4]
MKTKRISFYAGATLCFLLSFTSCLNDDPLVDWDAMIPVIELPYNSHNVSKTKVTPDENVTFDLLINYTIPDKKDSKTEIPVGLSVNEAGVETYNNANPNAGYELLPSSAYTLPAVVVIAPGTQLVEFPLEVNTSQLEPKKKYLLPVVISSVPSGYTVSGNFGHVYLRVDMN